MAWLPNASCMKLKCAVLRWAGANVGRNVELFQGFKVQGIGALEIEDGAFIGHETLILLNEGSKVHIGKNAVVSSRCTLMTGFHPIEPFGERIIGRSGTSSEIYIGDGAAVLACCQILPGVKIGAMAMVAAGATVAQSVDTFTLVGGCPAKEIRKLK